MGNLKSKRQESVLQKNLRLKREKAAKRKFAQLPLYKYNPIFSGTSVGGGGGGPTLKEIWDYTQLKYPSNLKADDTPTSIYSGYKSRSTWRWMKQSECKKWCFRGDLLLGTIFSLAVLQKQYSIFYF